MLSFSSAQHHIFGILCVFLLLNIEDDIFQVKPFRLCLHLGGGQVRLNSAGFCVLLGPSFLTALQLRLGVPLTVLPYRAAAATGSPCWVRRLFKPDAATRPPSILMRWTVHASGSEFVYLVAGGGPAPCRGRARRRRDVTQLVLRPVSVGAPRCASRNQFL